MNVLELVVKGSDAKVAQAWACGVCRIVKANTQQAEECCKPRLCACGATIEESWSNACKACRDRQDREKEAAARAKATVIKAADWNGHALWCSACSEFFRDVGDFIEHHFDSDGDAMPRYAWDCDAKALALDADSIVEHALQDHHEDAEVDCGKDEYATLQMALDVFCQMANVTSWEPSDDRIVDLSVEVEAYLRENAKESEAAT